MSAIAADTREIPFAPIRRLPIGAELAAHGVHVRVWAPAVARLEAVLVPSLEEYHDHYGLTVERLRRAAPDAAVLHPGPINRGVEITDEVADGPQSWVLRQVANGVAVRMAVLEHLLS